MTTTRSPPTFPHAKRPAHAVETTPKAQQLRVISAPISTLTNMTTIMAMGAKAGDMSTIATRGQGTAKPQANDKFLADFLSRRSAVAVAAGSIASLALWETGTRRSSLASAPVRGAGAGAGVHGMPAGVGGRGIKPPLVDAIRTRSSPRSTREFMLEPFQ
jgi:hypothetical protein